MSFSHLSGLPSSEINPNWPLYNKWSIARLEKLQEQDIPECDFFEEGYQLTDDFLELFREIWEKTRGTPQLTESAGQLVARSLQRYTDRTDLVQKYNTGNCEPKEKLQEEIALLIRVNHGFQVHFLQLLRKHHVKISRERRFMRELDAHGKRENPHGLYYVFTFFTAGTANFLTHDFPSKMKQILSRTIAIEWLKEDSARLCSDYSFTRIPLPEATIRTREGKVFKVMPTKGDGTCALHAFYAFLSPEGIYFSANARQKFTNKIQEKINDPEVEQKLTDILINYLNGTDPSSRMLFGTPEGLEIKTRWISLEERASDLQIRQTELQTSLSNSFEQCTIWMEEIKHVPELQAQLLAAAQNHPQFASLNRDTLIPTLESNPTCLYTLLQTNYGASFELTRPEAKSRLHTLLASHIPAQENPSHLHQQIEQLEQERQALKEETLHHYLTVIQNDTFFLNTQEITLAAHLYQINVRIYTQTTSGLQIADQYPPTLSPTQTANTIFYKNDHFSYCAEISTPLKKDLKRNFMQAEGHATYQLGEDARKAQIVRSTAKQEISQVGVSLGFAFVLGPAVVMAQIAKSTINVGVAYYDPDRETNLSLITRITTSPALNLMTGEPMGAKEFAIKNALPILIDLTARKYAFDENERGPIPETYKRFSITALSSILREILTTQDSDQIPSDLIGALVSSGMESLCEAAQGRSLNNSSWNEDPKWKDCIGRALLTNSASQQAMSQFSEYLLDSAIHLASMTDEDLDEFIANTPQPPHIEPEPIINPEVERHIEIIEQEIVREEANLSLCQSGVDEAQKKVWDKFEANQKKGTDKSHTSLDNAHANLKTFKDARDTQKAKVDSLKEQRDQLKERVYLPPEEQDYLNRVADEKTIWQRDEIQKRQGQLKEKETLAEEAKATMEEKFKEYEDVSKVLHLISFGIYNDNKEFQAYTEAKAKYLSAVEEVNTARANLGLPEVPAFPPKPVPPKGPIDKGLDKISGALSMLGVESLHLSTSTPLYSAPKSTTSSYHERQMDLEAQGGTPTTILGHASSEGTNWTPPKPTTPPEPPITTSPFTWETLQDYQAYSLMQTLHKTIDSRPPPSHPYTDTTDPAQQPHFQTHFQKWETVQDLQSLNTKTSTQPSTSSGPSSMPPHPYLDTAGSGHPAWEAYFPDTQGPVGKGRSPINPVPFAFAGVKANEFIADKKGQLINWTERLVEGWKNDPNQATKNLVLSAPRGAVRLAADLPKLSPAARITETVLEFFRASDSEPNTDKVVRIFDDWYVEVAKIDPDSPFSDIGVFVGECCVPLGASAKGASLAGRVALRSRRAFMRMEGIATSSQRALSRQAAFIHRMNNPVYRSGLGNPWSEMVSVQPRTLASRRVAQIEPKAIHASRSINRSNNCEFVTWVENGKMKTVSLGDLSHAGTMHDRGGLTKAGRALEKHGQRPDTVFPRPQGNIHQKNMEGQRILDEILNHPDKVVILDESTRSKELIIDVLIPNGKGARFTRDGKKMIGFLEP